MLGDRHRDAVDIHLLEGIGADHRQRHLAGDDDHRNRVQGGIGDRGDKVGRARAAGCDAHLRHTGHARHALSHEARALLMARQHMANQLAARKGVVKRQDGATGNTGNGTHALAFEEAHK